MMPTILLVSNQTQRPWFYQSNKCDKLFKMAFPQRSFSFYIIRKQKKQRGQVRIGPTVKQKTIKSDFTTVRTFISFCLFNLIRSMFLSLTQSPSSHFYHFIPSPCTHLYFTYTYMVMHPWCCSGFHMLCIKPKRQLPRILLFIILLSYSIYTLVLEI